MKEKVSGLVSGLVLPGGQQRAQKLSMKLPPGSPQAVFEIILPMPDERADGSVDKMQFQLDSIAKLLWSILSELVAARDERVRDRSGAMQAMFQQLAEQQGLQPTPEGGFVLPGSPGAPKPASGTDEDDRNVVQKLREREVAPLQTGNRQTRRHPNVE